MSVKSISTKYKPIKAMVAFYNAKLLGCWLPLDASSRPINLLDSVLLGYLANYGIAQSPFSHSTKTSSLKRKDILIPIISQKATANDKGRVPVREATKISQLFNPFNIPLFILDSMKFALQLPFQNICSNQSNRALSRLQQSALEKKSFVNKKSNTQKYLAITLATIDATFMIASIPIRVCKVALWGATELASNVVKSIWHTLSNKKNTTVTTNYHTLLKKLHVDGRHEKNHNVTLKAQAPLSDAHNLKTRSGLFKAKKHQSNVADIVSVTLTSTETKAHQPR